MYVHTQKSLPWYLLQFIILQSELCVFQDSFASPSPTACGGVYPVRDIILHHYHHRHHHRDGSHLDILRLSLTHYPTYAHWRHSVSQSVSRSVGPCDSFGFMLGFPVRAPFWIAHELSGDPVESCVYLQRDKWFLIWHSNWEND